MAATGLLEAAQGSGAGRLLRALLARGAPPPVAEDRVARAGLLVWAPVFFSTGIGTWFALTVEPGATAYTAAALILAVAMVWGQRFRRGAISGRLDWARADLLRMAMVAVALSAAGFLTVGLRAHLVAAPVLEFRYYGPIEGRVVAIDRSARDRMRLTLDRLRLNNMPSTRVPQRIRLSLTAPQPLPPPGSRVMLTGHLGPNPGPAEPSGFDFRRAAFFERLGAVGYTRNPVVTVAPAVPGPLDARLLRQRLADGIRDRIGGQAGAVAAALMTGDRSGILESTNQTMRDSNLYHIVSISGLHMSMLAAFVYSALRLALAAAQATPFGRNHTAWPIHKAAGAGALGVASTYLWLSGGGVPTERAFVMVAVMLCAILLDRRAVSLRTVAVAAMAILVTAPEALVTPGFQMSFAATAALILLFPAWSRHAAGLPWIVRGAALLILSSLIAGVATAPIAAFHFNRSAQYGLIANLLVVPVMGAIVMPAGVIAALLAPLGLAGPALWAMGLGTAWMLYVAEMVAGWGGAVIATPQPHWAVLPLGGAGATVALLALHAPVHPLLGRLAAGAGAGTVCLAASLWAASARPELLVAGDGSAVGIMTPQGRALSKPAGAFVTESWLRADGDTAEVETAALRPGWTGPRGARNAEVNGVRVTHLTGKGAVARAPAACAQGGIVILQGAAPRETGGRCLMLDQAALRGDSRAAWRGISGLVWVSAAEATGARLWSSSAARQSGALHPGIHLRAFRAQRERNPMATVRMP